MNFICLLIDKAFNYTVKIKTIKRNIQFILNLILKYGNNFKINVVNVFMFLLIFLLHSPKPLYDNI